MSDSDDNCQFTSPHEMNSARQRWYRRRHCQCACQRGGEKSCEEVAEAEVSASRVCMLLFGTRKQTEGGKEEGALHLIGKARFGLQRQRLGTPHADSRDDDRVPGSYM